MSWEVLQFKRSCLPNWAVIVLYFDVQYSAVEICTLLYDIMYSSIVVNFTTPNFTVTLYCCSETRRG